MAEAAPKLTIPFKVVEADRIPAKRYYDAEFYALECEKLWPHVWQMACRVEQLPQVGDWVEYSNLGQSVIIVRTTGGIKAFHNACRHRGLPLAKMGGHGNCKSAGFICPFHGWRWNSEGKNTFVYGSHLFEERQLDEADLALRLCRAEEAIGCVFINFDDDAPSFSDTIGPVLGRLEKRGHSDQRAEWWYATELPANWKTAMEAFMEGYHVMRTHPQLQQAAPMLYNMMYGIDTGGIGVPINPNMTIKDNIGAQIRHLGLLSEGMSGMVHEKELEIARQLADVPLPDDPQQALMTWFGIVQHQVCEQLRAKGENVPDLNALAVSDPLNAVEFLFPHYFLLPFFTSTSAYRIRPTGPETCLFEIWSLTHFAPGEETASVLAPTVLPYDSDLFPPIPKQDYSNIPIQQKGLHAKGFDFMRLSSTIEGMISNYNRILDGHLEGKPADKLAAATHTLGGNFDGKIIEYDF